MREIINGEEGRKEAVAGFTQGRGDDGEREQKLWVRIIY